MKALLKRFYDFMPFKKEAFDYLKLLWKPKHAIYKHLHFKDIYTVSINKQKKFKIRHYGYQLENEIYWAGLVNGWEKESIKLWLKLCEKSDVILDIGANTGIYSLVAKAVNPNAEVYAFEPVNRVFKKLKDNISLNNFDIKAFELAVSNSDGNAIIYDTTAEHTYSVAVNKNLLPVDTKSIETQIDLITLNTFIRSNSIHKIDLIKIDVETHEPEVLEGFSQYLKKFQPTLLIEILDNDIGRKVQNILHGMDYLYFNIDENAHPRQVDVITKSDYFNYLICNPNIAKEINLIK